MRTLLLLLLVVGVAGYVYYHVRDDEPVIRSADDGPIDPEQAREVGAEIGERTARAANKALNAVRGAAGEAASAIDERTSRATREVGDRGEAAGDAAVTTALTAALAGDDLLCAETIDVTTDQGVVTLRGTVASEQARGRALDLAHDTPGVERVVDRLAVGR